MGSSRRYSPPPVPYGFGSYEQGTDSSGTGAVMPKGVMPDNYTPQTQQPTNAFAKMNQSPMGGIFGAMSNMSQGNQTGSYSPFFMRF